MSQHDAERGGGRGDASASDEELLDDPLVDADDDPDLPDPEAEDDSDGDFSDGESDDLDLDDEDDDSDDDEPDDDDSDDDDSDDDDDEYDDLDDATEDEIDLVVAVYREDGQPVAVGMPPDLANDLEELIVQLRRLPADAGAIGFVSIAGEFFVICRVRGRNVQVVLSDGVAANDWPIARDVADYLGVDIPDPDDDSESIGDLGLLTDQGISDFELENYASDLETDTDQIVLQIADRMRLGPLFRRAMADEKR